MPSKWQNGQLVAEEDRILNIGMYFTGELLLLLEQAGFGNVVVQGDHNDAGATSDDDFIVFIAQKR